MGPALTPYTRETARYTVPYSLMHTGTYNRASREPSGLCDGVVCNSSEFQKQKENLDSYINLSNICTDMDIEENGTGEYHTLNSKIWNLIETEEKTDDRGRIHLNRNFAGQEPRVFVADDYLEPETCKRYIILTKSKWDEVRKIRGKEAGEPLEIQSNGDIWTGHKNKFVKVFVRK